MLYGKYQSKKVSGRLTFFERSKTKFPFKCHMCQKVGHKEKCCHHSQIEYKQKSSVAEEEDENGLTRFSASSARRLAVINSK